MNTETAAKDTRCEYLALKYVDKLSSLVGPPENISRSQTSVNIKSVSVRGAFLPIFLRYAPSDVYKIMGLQKSPAS